MQLKDAEDIVVERMEDDGDGEDSHPSDPGNGVEVEVEPDEDSENSNCVVQLQLEDFSCIQTADEFELGGGLAAATATGIAIPESGGSGGGCGGPNGTNITNPTILEPLRFQTIEVNGHPVWQLQLDDPPLRKDIDHCLTCGCFALRQEFFKPHYCVEACYYSSPQWLEEQQQLNAPIKLFKQPALPSVPNPFKKNQLLEAIDPENQSLFCVVSITEVLGWRLKLHFEEYSEQYDFWVDCDSLNIFPPGWCAEMGYFLQPPQEYSDSGKVFNWHSYIVRKGQDPAPRDYFQITKETDALEEEILGSKLEAVDIRANNLIICVATVTKVMGHRFLVHFDSWDNIYDYWTDLSSSFVFPIGHCERNHYSLTPPNGYEDFCWERYLSETKTEAMPSHLFQPLPPVGFKKGMRLECVDLKNPRLIRPAVIHSTEGHMVTVRYEGWHETYDVKMNELSGDLHPVGYCETTGHNLERVPKPSRVVCPNLCQWKGNAFNSQELSHTSKSECPYLVDKEKERVERVVVLIPPGSSGASPLTNPPHVLPGSSLRRGESGCPSPNSLLPSAFLKQSMTVGGPSSLGGGGGPSAKKIKREDILAKMMSLAQTVLQEERPTPFLFDQELEDLTPVAVRAWDVDETYNFVASLPACGELAKILKEQLVDGDALLMLSKQDFVGMSETIHWMKLYYSLSVIKYQNGGGGGGNKPAEEGTIKPKIEPVDVDVDQDGFHEEEALPDVDTNMQ